ncbi:hypothetical protein [Marilutibacter maris]|uniref:Transmembrane protein n=1 Tax=Marilutibacter maris TaxID=1605891 RepID=A0A2U9TD22_9GAMM|nr:hypothetical protein [Lysobacter maris]AWV06140.1 hypothetical protein C9I47_0416 [Lysobacter maris]
MNPSIELNLALILFLPWYAILACLYWLFPRQPRTLQRWMFDVLALTVAVLATVISMHWGYRSAGRVYDTMWPQILATSVSYGVFLAVMTAAWYLRRRFITAPHAARVAAGELPSTDSASAP